MKWMVNAVRNRKAIIKKGGGLSIIHAIFFLHLGWKTKESLCYLAEGSSMDTGTTVLWGISAGFFSSPEESEIIANSVQDSGGVCFIPAFSGLQVGAAALWDKTRSF